MPSSHRSRTTVVIATRDRAPELDRTLQRLLALDPRPPVIVVDNGSADATVKTAASYADDGVRVLALDRNMAAAARNRGAAAARTPYVAFSDDDSWWDAAALGRAERVFDDHPGVGLIAGRTLVGPEQRDDDVNALMADSPLGRPRGLPGPRVLGFLACASIVRREAFIRCGGFSPLLGVGGEEALLAYDLAAGGWELCYVSSVVAHHHPSTSRPPSHHRARTMRRNAQLVAWMRRPAAVAIRRHAALLRRGLSDRDAAHAAGAALRLLPAAVAGRRRLPRRVERRVRSLEEAGAP